MPRLFKDVCDGEVVVLQHGMQIRKTLEDGLQTNACDYRDSSKGYIIPDNEVTYLVQEYWDDSEPVE
jgi:hypothetical protein